MENRRPTQNQMVLAYIREHGSITHLEAEKHLGVMRLASRISDLKNQGHKFDSKFVTVLNRNGQKCRVKSYRFGGDEVG